ncbi:MAG: Maf family protein [Candidatus Babeliaceae bacterium]
MKKLYVASKSPSRRMLLDEVGIEYIIIRQDADELACDWTLPLEQLTQSIALHKMEHAVLPTLKENDIIFVLTADSLVQDTFGNVHGKPESRADAVEKIKKIRQGGRCGTSFCLDRKVFKNNKWELQERITETIVAAYQLDISDEWIEYYLDRYPIALEAAGGFAVEGFGSQFIKTINGSPTTIIGLPVCEVRKALQKLGFFEGIIK